MFFPKRLWLLCFWSVLFLISGLASQAQTTVEKSESILDYVPSILASHQPLPKRIDFKVARPRISGERTYTVSLGSVNQQNSVAVTNRLQDEIDQAAANGFAKVFIPDGEYLIGKPGTHNYRAGLELPGNIQLELANNAVLRMATNDKWNYCIVAIRNKTDVIIRGGQFIGDRSTHIFTPRARDGATAHDEGHAICVEGDSQRVLIEKTRIHQATGDGVLLVGNVKDITIRNSELFNNRRQGVSIVGGQRIVIEKNEIHHMRGTPPQFGVDIEGVFRIDKDIIIRNNEFHHNRGGDIVNTNGTNVFIINNTLHQGEGNTYIDGPLVTWERTDNVIANNTITMLSRSVNGLLGYIQYSGNRDNNPTTTYVHDNVCHGCGMYMYNANNADIRRNQFLGYFLALYNFKNATVIDNQVTFGPPGSPRYCWTYRIQETTGQASGNTLEGAAVNLPLSNTPWTTACLRR